MNSDIPHPIKIALERPVSLAEPQTPAWKQLLVFCVGFFIQFDILIGAGGDGASSTGGYGYRIIDFFALGCACLLGIHALSARRILAVALYVIIVAVLFAAPTMSSDPRTAILTVHYILYSFAALYVVLVVNEVGALERFCWGLILGLLATLAVFLAQASDYGPKLLEWGLVPGYVQQYGGFGYEAPRYTGLSGHPNEAAHVAALSAAAGAYFGYVRRRFVPVFLTFAGLMAVFYFTWSRGGLLAGSAILSIPFLFSRGRFSLPRFAVMSGTLVVLLIAASQLDFVASRFGDDPNASDNVSDRFASIMAGVQTLLGNPLGLSIDEFISQVAAGSGGVGSPHNGFLFFGGIFGVLPLTVLIISLVSNVRIRNEVDAFFALFALQISLSFMFEILTGAYSYAFAVCLVCARAFIRTPIGRELDFSSSILRRGRSLSTFTRGRQT